jgi:hypothetical protein
MIFMERETTPKNMVSPKNLVGRVGQTAIVIRRGVPMEGLLRVHSEGDKLKFHVGPALLRAGEAIKLRVARIVPRKDGTNRVKLIHTHSPFEFQYL